MVSPTDLVQPLLIDRWLITDSMTNRYYYPNGLEEEVGQTGPDRIWAAPAPQTFQVVATGNGVYTVDLNAEEWQTESVPNPWLRFNRIVQVGNAYEDVTQVPRLLNKLANTIYLKLRIVDPEIDGDPYKVELEHLSSAGWTMLGNARPP